MLIGVTNSSTLVSDEDAYAMTLLVNYQLRYQAAPAFDRLPPEIHYFPDPSAVPAGTFVVGILDDSDQAGALGYHELGFGRVFAQPVLSNGGGVFSGDVSVSSVLSHETLESFGDVYANLWGDTGDNSARAYELGDPVESDSYAVTVTSLSGQQVSGMVSNFVLPSWFDPDGEKPYDYLGLLTAPFQVRPDGYVITMTDGNVTEQWGERYPDWRKATKAGPGSRTARRHAKAFSATLLT